MAPGLATRLAGVLARQKIAGELVTSVIGEYMKANVTSSTQKVSFFIGHSPSMELRAGSDEKLESAVELGLDPWWCQKLNWLTLYAQWIEIDSAGQSCNGFALWSGKLLLCGERSPLISSSLGQLCVAL